MVIDEVGSSQDDLDTLKTPLTREDLYALVWSEPMLKVATKFGVSSSYMARICALLNVPRPERGYWVKLTVGKAPQKPALPNARPGDELVWTRDGEYSKVARPLPRPPSSKSERKSNSARYSQHPLVYGVKGLFVASRYQREDGYLRPDKRLLVDVIVTKANLEKALAFANDLFSLFEQSGYRVVMAPKRENFLRAEVDEHEEPRQNRGYDKLWSPWRCTVVYIGTVAIGLTIIELSEQLEVRYKNGKYIREQDCVPPKRGRYAEHTWTTKKDFPTGRLCLQAYSPYPRALWVKQWRETKDRNLNTQIKQIVNELERAVVDIARLVEEGERQAEIERKKWEAQQEQWHREQAERKAAKALKESRIELLQIIEAWASSNRVEQFFRDAEQRIAGLSESERINLLDRLKRARQLAGSVDALDYFMKWKSPDER